MAVKKEPAGAARKPASPTAPTGLLDDVIQPLVEHEPAFRAGLEESCCICSQHGCLNCACE